MEVRNHKRHVYKWKFLENFCAAECCIDSQQPSKTSTIRNQFEKVCVKCTELCTMLIVHQKEVIQYNIIENSAQQ